MNRIAILIVVTMLAAPAFTQGAPAGEDVRRFTVVPGPGSGMAGNNFFYQDNRIPVQDLSFFSAEVAGAQESVTNAPYTATEVTETTQVLSDGNRIVNKNSAFVARDSQGRTRREVTFARIGTMQMEPQKVVFINDPATHTQSILTSEQGAQVMRTEKLSDSLPTIVDLRTRSETRHIMEQKIVATHGGVPQVAGAESSGEEKLVRHEDLGTQTIEGVSAEGKRETITIPSGRIGNERPIEIVSETWFSPELHTMVMRKHSDPRTGEILFRLTEIRRVEPDASLFQPPPGTKVKADPVFEIKRHDSEPKE